MSTRRAGLALLLVSVMVGMVSAHAAAPVSCLGFDVNDERATEFADFLTGSDVRDVIALGDGDDQYFAADGYDVICGNAGDDVLGGEAGQDQLNGGNGDDIIAGLGGHDELFAGEGRDVLRGHNGDDVLHALAVDGVQDTIYDGFGEDVIEGQSEDVWHRCDDGLADPHEDFTGVIVPDNDCG